jgi:hypothetical protein
MTLVILLIKLSSLLWRTIENQLNTSKIDKKKLSIHLLFLDELQRAQMEDEAKKL